ncbi:MAG: response regulator, partial [Solirubrobacteraceae bacterium]
LDWNMPGGGGPEAARQILSQHKDTVIVGLTSSEHPGTCAEMIAAGASRVLIKGGSVAELANAIIQSAQTPRGRDANHKRPLSAGV